MVFHWSLIESRSPQVIIIIIIIIIIYSFRVFHIIIIIIRSSGCNSSRSYLYDREKCISRIFKEINVLLRSKIFCCY